MKDSTLLIFNSLPYIQKEGSVYVLGLLGEADQSGSSEQ